MFFQVLKHLPTGASDQNETKNYFLFKIMFFAIFFDVFHRLNSVIQCLCFFEKTVFAGNRER